MKTSPTSLRKQTGAYLLEALIGILIFALGVLGIVGLQAASLRTTTDSAMRAEAVFAANQLIGQMWADDEANLDANYSSAFSGQPYKDFAAQLKSQVDADANGAKDSARVKMMASEIHRLAAASMPMLRT